MFDLAEKTLDQVTLLVQMRVVRALHGAVGLGRNDCIHLVFPQGIQQRVGVIAFVRQQGCGLDSLKQIRSLANIRFLSAREDESQWTAQRIRQGVDFRREPPSGAPERVFFRTVFFAPAAHACARTTVLSISTCCRSASAAT